MTSSTHGNPCCHRLTVTFVFRAHNFANALPRNRATHVRFRVTHIYTHIASRAYVASSCVPACSHARITISIDRGSIPQSQSRHEISLVHLPLAKRWETDRCALLLLLRSSCAPRCECKGACKYTCYRIFFTCKTKNKERERACASFFFLDALSAAAGYDGGSGKNIAFHTAFSHCAREALPGSVIKFRSLVTCCLKREQRARAREYIRRRGEYHRSRLTDGSCMADVSACATLREQQ